MRNKQLRRVALARRRANTRRRKIRDVIRHYKFAECVELISEDFVIRSLPLLRIFEPVTRKHERTNSGVIAE